MSAPLSSAQKEEITKLIASRESYTRGGGKLKKAVVNADKIWKLIKWIPFSDPLVDWHLFPATDFKGVPLLDTINNKILGGPLWTPLPIGIKYWWGLNILFARLNLSEDPKQCFDASTIKYTCSGAARTKFAMVLKNLSVWYVLVYYILSFTYSDTSAGDETFRWVFAFYLAIYILLAMFRLGGLYNFDPYGSGGWLATKLHVKAPVMDKTYKLDWFRPCKMRTSNIDCLEPYVNYRKSPDGTLQFWRAECGWNSDKGVPASKSCFMKKKTNSDGTKQHIGNRVKPLTEKQYSAFIDHTPCLERQQHRLGEDLCEKVSLGGYEKCRYTKDSKCKGIFRWNETRQGQPMGLPIPGIGDFSCELCDRQNEKCSLAPMGYFMTVLLGIAGVLMVVYGAVQLEAEKKLNDEDSDYETPTAISYFNNISVGFGMCNIVSALLMLFFTLYCPDGSDMGAQMVSDSLSFYMITVVGGAGILAAGFAVPIMFAEDKHIDIVAYILGGIFALAIVIIGVAYVYDKGSSNVFDFSRHKRKEKLNKRVTVTKPSIKTTIKTVPVSK